MSKSPLATARVPATRSWIGRTSRRAAQKAPYSAPHNESNNTKVSASVKPVFHRRAQPPLLAVALKGGSARAAQPAEPPLDREHRLQHARLVAGNQQRH